MLHGIGFYEMTAHLTTRTEHHKKRAAEFEEKATKVMEAFEKYVALGGRSSMAAPSPNYMEIIGNDVIVAGNRQRMVRHMPETSMEAERRRAESVVAVCRQAQAEHLQRVEEFSFVAAHLKNNPSSTATTRDFLELSYDELVTFEFIKPRGLQNQRTQFVDATGLELCDIMDFEKK